jgi:hypothetical protein
LTRSIRLSRSGAFIHHTDSGFSCDMYSLIEPNYTLNSLESMLCARHVAKKSTTYRCRLIIIAWQGIADALQTAALAASEDYKLKDLAEVFQLSGSLLGT